MYQDYYARINKLKDKNFGIWEVQQAVNGIHLYSIVPLGQCLTGKFKFTYEEAVERDKRYDIIIRSAAKVCDLITKYYLGSEFACLWEVTDPEGSPCVVKRTLEELVEDKKVKTQGEVFDELTVFKNAHTRLWKDLAANGKNDYALNFWSNINRTGHADLTQMNHFLVHSVKRLNQDYYRSYLKDVPVSCSVFRVDDPWYYQCCSRSILLVYDTSECDFLGCSERDCSSQLTNLRIDSEDAFRLLNYTFGMPNVWDFNCMFQMLPHVSKEKLLEQVEKHDANDVGEVIVFGDPCAVILDIESCRSEDRKDAELFAKFFRLPIYASIACKLVLLHDYSVDCS